MGIPITRYSLLSKLMRKGERPTRGLDQIVEEEARYIQNKFSLYAFVLCDYRDEPFRQYVTDHFTRLDRRTGSNLLFFSLVKPYADVEYKLKSHYSAHEAMVATDYYPVNDSLYQHGILEAFQVSLCDLPAIVVTTSLESSQWYVIRVADSTQASQWLITLSRIADDIACGEKIDIAEELDVSVSASTCSGSWFAVEGAPICELIAVVEAAAAASTPFGQSCPHDVTSARSVVFEVCERLKARSVEGIAEGEDPDEKSGAIIRLVKYLELISNRRMSDRVHRSGSMFFNRCGLEPDTVRYMEIYEALRFNPVLYQTGDYTVLCSLLHKIFESEINASVLQLMRKNIDIPMPEFYDKFYPDSKRCYVQRPEMREGINLNRYVKGAPLKYVSPGLGKVLMACRILSEDKASFRDDMSSFGMDEMSLNDLCQLWDSICQIRNREAHCQVITGDQYNELLDAVSCVMRNYQLNLFKMKSSLRGVAEA